CSAFRSSWFFPSHVDKGQQRWPMTGCRAALEEVPTTPRAMRVDAIGWPDVVIADTCPTRTKNMSASTQIHRSLSVNRETSFVERCRQIPGRQCPKGYGPVLR